MSDCDFCRRASRWKWGRYRLCHRHLEEWVAAGRLERAWAEAAGLPGSHSQEGGVMKQTHRYSVRVRVRGMDRGGGDLAGFLDMLRYDGATVIDWMLWNSDDGRENGFTVFFLTDRPATMDRWHSMGMYPTEVL